MYFTKKQLHRFPTSTIISLYRNKNNSFQVPFEVIKQERKDEYNSVEASKRSEARSRRRSKHRYETAGERHSRRVLEHQAKEQARAAIIAWNESSSSKGRK